MAPWRPHRSPGKRTRGEIETLPSGSLRVRVYAGIDPVSKKKHYLVETVPAGPKAAKDAEKVRTRLLNQVDEKRNPRTRATVNQLMDRYLELIDIERRRRGHVRGVHPEPHPAAAWRLAGRAARRRGAGLVLRAAAHVPGALPGPRVRRAPRQGEHECDGRCRPHVCRPLADSSIRQIHGILSGACKRAVRWRWLGTNPIEQAEPPTAGRTDPRPPTPEQAARIANEAWADPDWGMLVWLALMTGARRGELCALAWDRRRLRHGRTDDPVKHRADRARRRGRSTPRRTSSAASRSMTERWRCFAPTDSIAPNRPNALGFELPADARIFSLSPDGSTWLKPDSVGQRYVRMCARLGWDMMRKARWTCAVMFALVLPVGALVTGLAYLVLRRRWSDRLIAVALTVLGVGGDLVGDGCAGLLVGVAAHRRVAGRGCRREPVDCGRVGDGGRARSWRSVPALGGLLWMVTQPHRERSPFNGADEREHRQLCEERRRLVVTHAAQRARHTGPRPGRGDRPAVAGGAGRRAAGRSWAGSSAVTCAGRGGRTGGCGCRWHSPNNRHLLILGATGLGKTETALTIAEWAARNGRQVIYLTCKEPPSARKSAAPRLAAIADQHGLRFRSLTGPVGAVRPDARRPGRGPRPADPDRGMGRPVLGRRREHPGGVGAGAQRRAGQGDRRAAGPGVLAGPRSAGEPGEEVRPIRGWPSWSTRSTTTTSAAR